MKLDLYQINAFAEKPFEGNPAAVAVLDKVLPATLMQSIAAELNLSETAFVVKQAPNEFNIRWFTPSCEVALCGHGTLASAHVLYEHLDYPRTELRFHSLSGLLTAVPSPHGIELNFPSIDLEPIDVPNTLNAALGATAIECHSSGEFLIAIFDHAEQVRAMTPDFNAIAGFPSRTLTVAAVSDDPRYDFICRMFAPKIGINEDPVTGSAYTRLGPLFANKLGKATLVARQVSKRGGDVYLTVKGDRVLIAGKAASVMQMQMDLSGICYDLK